MSQNIIIDQVNRSLESFKKSTSYVSFLQAQINNNVESIKTHGYPILRPIFEKKYPEFGNYGWITSLPSNPLDARIEFQYSSKFDFLQGQKVFSIQTTNPNLRKQTISVLRDYYKNKKKNFYLSIHNFVKKQMHITIFMRDVTNPEQYIALGSAIELENIIPDPPQSYLNFVTELSKLEGGDIFEYGDDFSQLKCISSTYPWNGKRISDCYVPGSNENIPLLYKNIISEINSYPSLLVNQKCYVTYQFQNKSWVSAITILPNSQFSQRSILLNDYFPYYNDIGDKIQTGSYTVNGIKGNVVLHADPSTNITCLHEKVGINQTASEVNAILDIDTNSQEQITMINDTITKSLIILHEIQNESGIYNFIQSNEFGDITIFSAPIKKRIEKTDIEVLNGSFTFDDPSFLKIQIILHELTYSTQGEQVYTFIETINDTSDNYLLVMAGIIVDNEMIFLVIPTNINSIMNDSSLSKRFSKVIAEYSGLNRSLNYAVSLLSNTTIQNDLLNKNSSSFTNAINSVNSVIPRYGKFFCFSVNPDMMTNSYLFHEQYPQWNDQLLKNLFFDDFKVIDVANKILFQFTSTYGSDNVERCLLEYMWINGLKVSFVNQITIQNKKYLLCVGMNVVDYLVPSIHSRGDSVLSGNFTVQDESQNVIFQIDNYEKNIKNMYNVGIGTPFPKTSLDIQDSGVDDIIHLIQDISKSDKHTNRLLTELKNIDMTNTETVNALFNNIQQTNDMYYGILRLSDLEYFLVYNWLYPEWTNIPISQLCTDPTFSKFEQLFTSVKSIFSQLLSSYSFDGSMNQLQFPWTFGIKQTKYYFFVNNEKLYALGIGKNTQSYNLKMKTNSNILNYFNCETAYSYYLQKIILHNIVPPNQRNISVLEDLISTSQQSYPMTTYTLYTINSIPENSSVTIYDFTTNQEISTTLIGEITNMNTKTRILSFVYNYTKYYSESTGYGTLHFEDIDFNYVSQFYNDSGSIYSVEFCIEDYIKPTVDVKGDTRLEGNVVVYDKYEEKQYVTMDPSNQYVGINTDDRTIYYNNDYSTTNIVGKKVAQHHVYITNDKYPNMVCERTNDNEKSRQNSYTTFSAFTMKRNSNTNTFKQMLDKTNEQNVTLTNGVGKNMYGVDLSAELSDSTKTTQEIGNISMGIDAIDQDGNIQAGFAVNVRDPNLVPRNILHVDNTGCLSANSINLKNNIISVGEDGLKLPPFKLNTILIDTLYYTINNIEQLNFTYTQTTAYSGITTTHMTDSNYSIDTNTLITFVGYRIVPSIGSQIIQKIYNETITLQNENGMLIATSTYYDEGDTFKTMIDEQSYMVQNGTDKYAYAKKITIVFDNILNRRVVQIFSYQ